MTKLSIQFFGATQEVTGSCFLIKVGQHKLLVDCGLIQGPPEEEQRNREPFPFNPLEIDAIVLTHSHIDHSGRLPLIAKAGFNGPIYTHQAAIDLCEVLLKDAGYLNEKEIEWENRKRQRKHQPLLEALYTMDDAEAVMSQFQPLVYNQIQTILPGVRLRLRDAGHILGSSIVELWVSDRSIERKLVFSGDLGHAGALIVRDPTVVHNADLVILETTYGNRLHRSWDDTWNELEDILQSAHHKRGNVLIPAFAVGRTQELLYAFNRNYSQWELDCWRIFLDSPMAIEATEVYLKHNNLFDEDAKRFYTTDNQPFMPPNTHYTRSAQESMNLNMISSGAIIIAGSGMCSGGRIKHHFKHNIWRTDCHVLIVGFQARGTLGRHLVDGAKEITLWGENIKVGASIHTIGGFSAHADASGLAQWYSHFHTKPALALVHGEADAMEPFATKMKLTGTNRLFTPKFGNVIDLINLT